jgi:FixJ family two-component response regulator
MTGIALSENLLAASPNLPIVLCTGYSDTVDDGIAKVKGITRFALKPLTGPDLVRIVDSAIAAPA